jgi:nucleolar protein 16
VDRTQSGFEKQWIEKLIEKHEDDYEAMFWDKKLNVYQQTAAQLKRKIAQYKRQTGTQ